MSRKKKEDIIKNAREMSREYHDKYGGCAQATFAAVADSLDLDYDESAFKAMVGLSGGVACLGTGSCGAVEGGAAAISLSMDVGRKKLQEDEDSKDEVYDIVSKFGEKFKEKYDDLTCRDVQMASYGMSFDLRDEKAEKEFEKIEDCDEIISDATAWAIDIILSDVLKTDYGK